MNFQFSNLLSVNDVLFFDEYPLQERYGIKDREIFGKEKDRHCTIGRRNNNEDLIDNVNRII